MAHPPAGGRPPRFSPWSLLLLLPLLILVTPLWNYDYPRLFGLPFFYWSQLGFVLVGVVCTWLAVRAMHRRETSSNRGGAGR